MSFKNKYGRITEQAYDGATFDFIGGVRIEVPNTCSARHFKLINLDTSQVMRDFIACYEEEDKSIVEYREKTKNGLQIISLRNEDENLTPEDSMIFSSFEKSEYINWRIEQYDDQDNLVFYHNLDLKEKEVWIEIYSFSLGDSLAWFKCVENFRIAHDCNVHVIISEKVIDLFKNIYTGLTFHRREERRIIPDSAYAMYFVGTVCGSSMEDYKNRSFFDQYFPLISLGYKTLGLPIDFTPPIAEFNHERLIHEKYICISTMSSTPNKNWEREGGWDELCRILKAEGYRVIDIDVTNSQTYFINGKSFKEEHSPKEAEDWTGNLPIAQRLQLLEHAECLVGLGSGAALMSWITHTPKVLILGSTMEHVEFSSGEYIPVQNFQVCRGCLTHMPKDSLYKVCKYLGTNKEFECTRHTTPEMVLHAIHKLIH